MDVQTCGDSEEETLRLRVKLITDKEVKEGKHESTIKTQVRNVLDTVQTLIQNSSIDVGTLLSGSLKENKRVLHGKAAYGNMDLMFANMVSSGLCVPIHQPQTHLCNLRGNLSEKRWAAESPPHCLAGPDEISKHTAAQASAPVLPQQSQVAEVCQDVRHMLIN